MKSPLWVELTENQVKKKKRNWISPGDNQHDQDPRTSGLVGEDANGFTTTTKLTDIEIIQKQILHFYNQSQFQKIVALKQKREAKSKNRIAVNELE